MSKNRKEIISDMAAYFKSAEVNGGRWTVEEVNMKLNRTNDSIVVSVTLLPNKKYISLNDLR